MTQAHAKHKKIHAKKKKKNSIPTKKIPWPTRKIPYQHNKFPCMTHKKKKKKLPEKIFHTHENFHTPEIKPTHPNKISTLIKKWVYSIIPTHQILMISIPTKTKPRFIQQYYKLHTMQGFMNHQHCPNFTIPNNSTIQKMPKKKKKKTYMTTQWFLTKSYNVQNSHKTNNNKMTMSHHKVLNKTWNQQIYQQKKELTLKSFLDECGAWF